MCASDKNKLLVTLKNWENLGAVNAAHLAEVFIETKK